MREPLQTMADGTIKQVNPFSGTEVWTVPGRGNRPLAQPPANPQPLKPGDESCTCAFCSDNVLSTPPEKSRMVDGEIIRNIAIEDIHGPYQFRRVPNLYEIVTYEYWAKNYGFEMNAQQRARMDSYMANPAGRAHVERVLAMKQGSAPNPAAGATTGSPNAEAFFAGGHDVIIGRRHFVDGAENDGQLASSGTLSVQEHRDLIRFTIDAAKDLYAANRYAPYVAIFQNWLKPAGASFDHLHKQLVAIDERGTQSELEIAKLRANPNMYNEWAVDYAGYHNLVIAENDYAVCFAGFGHRYPTLEVFSKSATPEPWLQTRAEQDGMSDLIHACHAAAGPQVPCNEEWHHKPIDLDMPMPWRVMIKWRVSTLAGFEGGTKIYLNTLSPQVIRDKMVSAMYELRDAGKIASTIKIATECSVERNSLRYNPFL